MKPRQHRRSEAGTSFIEMLIYIMLLAVVIGVGGSAMIRLWSAQATLRRQADALVLATDTGERWRADVRAATGLIESTTTPDRQTVTIPVRGGWVGWEFSQGTLWRLAGPEHKPAPLLRGTRASTMSAEPRGDVTAWRWELELRPATKHARTAPRFTFTAVTRGGR